MVREEHRLGVLQVGVARQDDVEVLLGLSDERLAQRRVRGHEVGRALLGVQARIGGHLVVARAARVQPRARVPDASRQLRLDGHVHVLALLHIKGKRAGLDVS